GGVRANAVHLNATWVIQNGGATIASGGIDIVFSRGIADVQIARWKNPAQFGGTAVGARSVFDAMVAEISEEPVSNQEAYADQLIRLHTALNVHRQWVGTTGTISVTVTGYCLTQEDHDDIDWDEADLGTAHTENFTPTWGLPNR
ncbi:MAG: hypothetical protein KDA74_21050, partial [Planctomycetaceae bacterium]|nr:hypothetical protein [Planctomycetaceae bacterium]